MAINCTVCDHPQRDIIDGILAAGSIGRRTIANRFGLTDSAVQRHRTSHLTKRIVKAVERNGAKADDVFMQRHEHLYRETLQYIEDAKSAVKVQKTGPETYTQFRDVGAMAPALTVAAGLQRTLGDALGRFSQAQPASGQGISVNVMIPAGAQVSIDARNLEQPDQPGQLEPAIDVKSNEPTE